MVDQTRETRNGLARQLLRLHAAVTTAPRTRCWWCLRPLTDGVCAACDAVGLEQGAEDGEAGTWR